MTPHSCLESCPTPEPGEPAEQKGDVRALCFLDSFDLVPVFDDVVPVCIDCGMNTFARNIRWKGISWIENIVITDKGTAEVKSPIDEPAGCAEFDFRNFKHSRFG